MRDQFALEFCEIDILFSTTTYGVGPCTASVGVTGPIKCFNTRQTCQDIENYAPEPVTLRFARDTGYLPEDIDCIASLVSVDYSPQRISLGKSLGERASITFVFRDHAWGDTGDGYDKYRTERPYDPAKRGKYWAKLRARHRSLNGRPIRWITGFRGQSLEEMETRHFIIESIDGPRKDGTFAVVAKDVLKLADGDKSQTPRLSKGVLLGDLAVNATSFTISPPGTGAEYPLSGHLSLGGNETVGFTRVGDVFTITREQLGTTASTHDALDRVQLVRSYDAKPISFILSDILINDCGVDPDYIPLAEWQAEEAAYSQALYSRHIAEATSSRKIIDEFIEQSGISVWTDDLAKKVRMRVLRGIPSDATVFSRDTNIVKGTFSSKDQPETRISQVITRHGLRNPLLSISERTSFRSVRHRVDVDSELLYGSPAIREINAAWIPAEGSAFADRVNELQLGRFAEPPRRFTFQVSRSSSIVPLLGMGARLEWPGMFLDATGAEIDTPIQITRVKPNGHAYDVEAEEMLVKVFNSGDLSNRIIIVPPDSINFNLRAAHNSVFPPITAADAGSITVTAVVEADRTVLSASTSLPSLTIGVWEFVPGFVLDLRGAMRGKDGNGGKGGNGNGSNNTNSGNGFPGVAGGAGGTAFYTRYPTDLKISTGELFGGRGGGGGGGGGGFGQFILGTTLYVAPAGGGGGGGSYVTAGVGGTGGQYPSTPYKGSNGAGGGGATGGNGGYGYPNSSSVGGRGGKGGNAQDYGQPGQNGATGATSTDGGDSPTINPGGAGGAGGAAGAAIDGWSFVTIVEGPGDIRGPKVN